jgi:hypothetical protein
MATSEGLTESDIPGAILEEPLEKATVHAVLAELRQELRKQRKTVSP